MDESVSGEHSVATHRGAARWLSVHDDLLRGLTHSLSNRVGTIAAASYMLEAQPHALGTTAATLRAESDRLEALLQLFRLLPQRSDAIAEPIIPTDAATQAIVLQTHHPAQRECATQIVLEGDLQPAYAEPAAFTMAITVALGVAQRGVRDGGHIELAIASSTDDVRVTARPIPADDTPGRDDNITDDVAAITWLLAAVDGRGEAQATGVTVVVPTLQAVRRRSRG